MRDSSLQIRPASLHDLGHVQDCARAAYAIYLDRMDREPAPMVADFSQLIADNKLDIAVFDNEPAGYVVYDRRGDTMLLENVAVLPAFSKRGIGRSLIAHVEAKASQLGLVAIELYTNEAMTENQAIYPKLGYTEIDRRLQDGFRRVFYRKAIL